MTDLVKALSHGWPNARWSLNGDGYDGLIWPAERARLEAATAAREAAAAAIAPVTARLAELEDGRLYAADDATVAAIDATLVELGETREPLAAALQAADLELAEAGKAFAAGVSRDGPKPSPAAIEAAWTGYLEESARSKRVPLDRDTATVGEVIDALRAYGLSI